MMKKNKGIKKLRLEKVTISKLTNLYQIKGGSQTVEESFLVSVYPMVCDDTIDTKTLALSKECEDDDYQIIG